MQWWSWMVFGIALLALELFAIDAQFYLVFLGAGALSVGLMMWLGIDLPSWLQWLVFAIVSIAFMFTVRRKLYELMRGNAALMGTEAIGESITIDSNLAPGASCRAEFRGSTWNAINVADAAIPAGSSARIEVVEGLTLHVRPQD